MVTKTKLLQKRRVTVEQRRGKGYHVGSFIVVVGLGTENIDNSWVSVTVTITDVLPIPPSTLCQDTNIEDALYQRRRPYPLFHNHFRPLRIWT